MRRCDPDAESGSILLPVLLLLLLIAAAATAMTMKAHASLQEIALRRVRESLSLEADAAVRATSLALAQAAESRSAPPFPLDGTAQGCRIQGRRRLALVVQDEGGRVDLNMGSPDLLLQILSRAVPGPEAKALTDSIVARRTMDQSRPAKVSHDKRAQPATDNQTKFATADELDGMPGVDATLLARLMPIFTTANGSAGLDPAVAAPAIRALIPPRELASPALEALTTTSSHADFAITATIEEENGPRFQRSAGLHMDPQAGPLGHFVTWTAPPALTPVRDSADAPFCARIAAALAGR